jgi:hypothetical protein
MLRGILYSFDPGDNIEKHMPFIEPEIPTCEK